MTDNPKPRTVYWFLLEPAVTRRYHLEDFVANNEQNEGEHRGGKNE